MFETRRVVSQIRGVLQRENRELNDSLKQLASEYLELCQLTNSRLQYCGEYLAKGLRGEAIRMAESQPAIMDEISTLDFPELPQWREVCDDYGLPFEPLLLEISDQLNKAYEGFDTLEAMLRNYRKLNLREAPLNHRLAYLRKLAIADPHADFWFVDIAEFEKARLKEISIAWQMCRKRCSLDGLYSLLEEVMMDSWSAPVPPSLIKDIEKAIGEVSRKLPPAKRYTNHRLGRITDAIEEAIAASRIARAEQLIPDWTDAAAKSLLPPDAATRLRGKELIRQLGVPEDPKNTFA